jgi:hypothetical protein
MRPINKAFLNIETKNETTKEPLPPSDFEKEPE